MGEHKIEKEDDGFVALSQDEEMMGEMRFTNEGDGVINIYHTEVSPAFEGQGIGSELVKFAVQDAKKNNYMIIPTCPFVYNFSIKHPDKKVFISAE